ncbi:MAG: hypothetical protein GC193_06895 [Cryomorphaceae bacterium]|nr:hypothetical protein [Cryomorphaceae bacterium]
MKKYAFLLMLTCAFAGSTFAQDDRSEEMEGKRIEKMTTELGLSTEQQTQMKAVDAKFKPEHERLRAQEKALREQRKELRKQQEEAMMQILTPEQKATWEAKKAEKKEDRKENRQEGSKGMKGKK